MEFLADLISDIVGRAFEWIAATILALIFPSKQMLDQQAVDSEWNVEDADESKYREP